MSQPMSLSGLVRSQFLAEKAGCRLKRMGFKKIKNRGTLRLGNGPLTSHIMLQMVAPKESLLGIDSGQASTRHHKPVAIEMVKKTLACPSETRSTSVIVGKGAIVDPTIKCRGVYTTEVAVPAIRTFDAPSILTSPLRDSLQNHLESIFSLSGLTLHQGYELLKAAAEIFRMPNVDLFVQFSDYSLSALHATLTFTQDENGAYCSVKNLSARPVYIGYNGNAGVVVLSGNSPGLISITLPGCAEA